MSAAVWGALIGAGTTFLAGLTGLLTVRATTRNVNAETTIAIHEDHRTEIVRLQEGNRYKANTIADLEVRLRLAKQGNDQLIEQLEDANLDPIWRPPTPGAK